MLLVKGQGVAQSYNRPLWRSCGDIDFFLNENNYTKAISYLKPIANHVDEEDIKAKHYSMTIDTWTVELHGRLYSGLWRNLDKTLSDVQNSIFHDGTVRTWMNGNTQIFLPRADEDVFYVFSHILQHFL